MYEQEIIPLKPQSKVSPSRFKEKKQVVEKQTIIDTPPKQVKRSRVQRHEEDYEKTGDKAIVSPTRSTARVNAMNNNANQTLTSLATVSTHNSSTLLKELKEKSSSNSSNDTPTSKDSKSAGSRSGRRRDDINNSNSNFNYKNKKKEYT